MNVRPIIVDLDGTLILTDTLHESLLKVLFKNPFLLLNMLFWLRRGKAAFKHCIAARSELNADTLPYNHDFLEWLRDQHAQGRKLILCTGANEKIAVSIATHLRIFDEVIASNESLNLTGTEKARMLETRFGIEGFEYAGNSQADLAVWQLSSKAIVVNASTRVVSRARQNGNVHNIFIKRPLAFRDLIGTLRLHQWSKNLLLFVPLIASHGVGQLNAWTQLLPAFFALSFCASSVYILNDLHDLESDRIHVRKRMRPLAAGFIPLWTGWLLIPLLLLLAFSIGTLVNSQFLAIIAVYFLLTLMYSLFLKSLVLVDCLTLAILYTLRIIAGAVAIGHSLSFWLLCLSVFLFLSLAFVKRYAELLDLQASKTAHGRGYHTSDLPLIHTMGVTAGYVSVLVLALYVNSPEVQVLYQNPKLIWAAVPVILYWISWIWMQTDRGNMHDDPLVFAVRDRTSLFCAAIFILIIVAGATGIPW